MIEQVKKYQSLGLHLYLLAPNTKIPIKGSKGFNDATNDLQQLLKWWSDNPTANIGIHLKPSRLIVVDIDQHEIETNGMENMQLIWRRYSPFPATYVEKTPRNGVHFFFKLPKGVAINQRQNAFSELLGKKKTGIDIITTGIPLAPTTTPDGAYINLDGKTLKQVAIAPNWLVDALQTNSKTIEDKYPKQAYNGIKKYTGVFLDELVQGAESGGRNEWIMRMTSKMLAVGADLETIYTLLLVANDNFLSEPLPLNEINATFKSRVKKHTRGGN